MPTGKQELAKRPPMMMASKYFGRRVFAFVAFILCACACLNVQAASFLCHQKLSDLELLICMDYRLSSLDSELSAAFRRASQSPKVRAELRIAQKAWLEQRNRCGSFDCVRSSYLVRLTQLNPELSRSSGKAQPSDRWHYVPENGFEFFGGLFESNSINVGVRELRLQRDAIGRFANEYRTVSLETGKSSPSKEPFAGMPIRQELVGQPDGVQFADLRLGSIGNSCSSAVDKFGLSVLSKDGNLRGANAQVLVAIGLTPMDSSMPPNCSEITLNFPRLDFFQSVVVGEFFYWKSKQFVIRFGEHLISESNLIGKKVWLAWGRDLKLLVGNPCLPINAELPDRACMDRRLGMIHQRIQKYY